MRQMQAIIPKLNYSSILVPDTYSFNQNKRFKWLQRLCIRILNKLGCQRYVMQSTFETVTVDFDNIVELVLKQSYAIECVTGRRCKYLVLGRKQMIELDLAVPEGHMLFQFPHDYKARIYLGSMIFAGLKVVIVPWFDGILCLPELERT
jgi:hypothetical protein